MRLMRLNCPRCGHILHAHEGEPDAECTWCSRYCEDGSEPSDCTLIDHKQATGDAWRGLHNWPQGMHMDRSKVQENTQARVKWCTVHGKFTDKRPLLVPVQWDKYATQRLEKKHRFNRDV